MSAVRGPGTGPFRAIGAVTAPGASAVDLGLAADANSATALWLAHNSTGEQLGMDVSRRPF